MQRPEDFYADLIPILDELGVPWAVAGALAALKYRATPRATNDADLIVAWHAGLVGALVDAGWDVRVSADPGDDPHLVRARKGAKAVDLLVGLTEYQQEALGRAVDHVLTVEDVLVHKLIAWRSRDRGDIESILSTGLPFDREYVAHWAREFGFEDRLAEAGLS